MKLNRTRMARAAVIGGVFAASLVRLAPAQASGGTINSYAIPAGTRSFPIQITTGSDGNMWFTEYGGQKVGRITPGAPNPATTFQEYVAPPDAQANPAGIPSPYGITSGPDGKIWYTNRSCSEGNYVGQLDPANGSIVRHQIPIDDEAAWGYPPPNTICGPGASGIVTGPDGKMWFTETNWGEIGRIDPATGTLVEFQIAGGTPNVNTTPNQMSANPEQIIVGPDGNLWFTEIGNQDYADHPTFIYPPSIARITPDGVMTQFPIPGGLYAATYPEYLTVGADGNIWYTDKFASQVGRVNPSTGHIDEFDMPGVHCDSAHQNCTGNNYFPQGIVTGPDNNLWITGFSTPLIRLNPFTMSWRKYGGGGPIGITVGPNANLWMANYSAGSIDTFVMPTETHVTDFDADTATDVSVFRSASGTWYAHQSRGADTALAYGASGDIPVPGDYDGDGKTDQAIFRPSSGLWAIHLSSGGDRLLTYGIGSDIPVPADYDGDRKADVAVYRPSTGTWFMHRSSTNTDTAVTYGGQANDIPVPGDYNGDGVADVAIYRPSASGSVFFVHPTNGMIGNLSDTATAWGTSGDIPVVGDYDGDTRTDVAIFRPSTGLWAIHNSSGAADTLMTYGGIGGDVPVAADYDGDGKTDIAIFRPSVGGWYEHRSGGVNGPIDTAVTYGLSTDTVLQLPYAVRRVFFP